MRYLMTLILALMFATPVMANPTFCSISGPQNCAQQNEDQLMAMTRNAVHEIQLTQDPHPFKTKNDEVLAAAQRNATQHAQLQQTSRAYTSISR